MKKRFFDSFKRLLEHIISGRNFKVNDFYFVLYKSLVKKKAQMLKIALNMCDVIVG